MWEAVATPQAIVVVFRGVPLPPFSIVADGTILLHKTPPATAASLPPFIIAACDSDFELVKTRRSAERRESLVSREEAEVCGRWCAKEICPGHAAFVNSADGVYVLLDPSDATVNFKSNSFSLRGVYAEADVDPLLIPFDIDLPTLNKPLKDVFKSPWFAPAFALGAPWLRRVEFLWFHVAVFVALGVAFAGGVWAVERGGAFGVGGGGLPFIDALFHSFSALTETGLGVFDLQVATVGTQVMTVLLMGGGGVMVWSLYFVVAKMKQLRLLAVSEGGGGVAALELRAMGVLLVAVPAYVGGWVALGTLAVAAHLWRVGADLGGVNVLWFSFFHSVSAFSNNGLVLLSDAVARFRGDPFFLLVTGGLVAAGAMGEPFCYLFYFCFSIRLH
jgi:hypothetical protein